MKQQMLEKEVAELKQQIIELINQNAELIKELRYRDQSMSNLLNEKFSFDTYQELEDMHSANLSRTVKLIV